MIQRTASAVVYVTAVAVLIGTAPYYLMHLGYVAPNEVSYSALLALLLVLAAFAFSFALLVTLQLLRVSHAPMQALTSVLLSCLVAALYSVLYLVELLPYALALLHPFVPLILVAVKRSWLYRIFGIYIALLGTVLSNFILLTTPFAVLAVSAFLMILAAYDYVMYRRGYLNATVNLARSWPIPGLVKFGEYGIGAGDLFVYSAAVHTVAVEALKFGVAASVLSVAVGLALLYAGILLTHMAFPARERPVPALPIPVTLLATLVLALWAA